MGGVKSMLKEKEKDGKRGEQAPGRPFDRPTDRLKKAEQSGGPSGGQTTAPSTAPNRQKTWAVLQAVGIPPQPPPAVSASSALLLQFDIFGYFLNCLCLPTILACPRRNHTHWGEYWDVLNIVTSDFGSIIHHIFKIELCSSSCSSVLEQPSSCKLCEVKSNRGTSLGCCS